MQNAKFRLEVSYHERTGDPVAAYLRVREGEKPRLLWASGKFLGSVLICLLMSCGGVYYAFFGCCLLVAAGAAGSFAARKLAPLGSALVLTMIVAFSTVLVLSPSLLYRLKHDANPEAVRRYSGEAEWYGLKLSQLVLPVTGHRVPLLARLKDRYNQPQTPLNNENDSATLGIV